MSEREREDRNALQRTDQGNTLEINHAILRINRRAQVCAVICVILTLCLSAFIAYLGNPVTAGTLAGGVIVALVAVFLANGRAAQTPSPNKEIEGQQ